MVRVMLGQIHTVCGCEFERVETTEVSYEVTKHGDAENVVKQI